MSRVPHMAEACPIYERVMPVRMRHVPTVAETCPSIQYRGGMLRLRMSYVSNMAEASLIYEGVISRIRMSHFE